MYRLANLGQAPAVPATYGCPINPPAPAPGTPGQSAFEVSVDPTLNCMRDARGNAICSDGMHYPPGCPHTPPDSVFTPGVTPDQTTNGRIEGQIPPPRDPSTGQPQVAASATAPGSSSGISPLLMVSAGALGAGLLATGAYFLFLRK